MYRAPDVTVRCVVCGGTSVTPPTTISGGSHPLTVYFASAIPGRNELFHADRARVCLDCGHVMLAMSEENLALLRTLAPTLRPYPNN